MDEQVAARVAAIFRSHAAAACMTLHEFTEALTSLGAKREYCTQYFKAFDRAGDGTVNTTEFMLGVVAMDNQTYHGGHWAEQRSQYIFRTYDLNGDGFLDYGEMLHLVRHLRRGRKESEAVADIEAQARELAEGIGTCVGRLVLWKALASGGSRLRVLTCAGTG